EDGLLGGVENRLEGDVRALVGGESLDQQPLAALDAVLLAAALHDRVHLLSARSSRLGSLAGPWRPSAIRGSPWPWQRNGAVRLRGHDAGVWIVCDPRRHRPPRRPHGRRRRARSPPRARSRWLWGFR